MRKLVSISNQELWRSTRTLPSHSPICFEAFTCVDQRGINNKFVYLFYP
jgi:hypothetical protein